MKFALKLKWTLAVVVVALAFCSAQSEDKEGPGSTSNTVQSGKPANSENYVIGSEDVLAVNIWKEPEISRTVPVRPDGKITLPLVGVIQASGLTPKALQENITQGLRSYVASPEVTVIV